MDANGNPLYCLRSKMMTIHNVQLGESGDDKELFRVRSHRLSSELRRNRCRCRCRQG
jgi:hypothetical protein